MSDYSKHNTGAKREKLNKLRYDLMPALEVNEAYARVANFGCEKYTADNWQLGLPMVQLSDSLQRHLWAWLKGENTDKESGLSHLDHVLWNAVALVYNEENKLCDNRIKTRLKDLDNNSQ
jgi:hypothetical protein